MLAGRQLLPGRACCRRGRCAALARCVASFSGYETVVGETSAEVEAKKSRFIAHAAHCSTPAEALAFVASRRDVNARHNCWAYIVQGQARTADDGEPSGTAGAPILRALEGALVNDTCVLVVRWFGGILLGTGGLQRAYGQAASAALRAAPRRRVIPTVAASLHHLFSDVGPVRMHLERAGAAVVSEACGDDGVMRLEVTVPASAAALLDTALADATSGRVRLIIRELAS